MLKNSFVYLGLITLLSFLILSCSNKYEIEAFDYKAEYDRVNRIRPSEEKNKKDLVIVGITKNKLTYKYSTVGKKDPFRSYFSNTASLTKEKKIVSELQNFDISNVDLTAIIWGVADPRAVIVTPDNKSYIVKKGSFIGKHWGKVNKILPKKIEIVETYKDSLGRKILNKLYLELPVETLLKEADVPVDDTKAFEKGKIKEKVNNKKHGVEQF